MSKGGKSRKRKYRRCPDCLGGKISRIKTPCVYCDGRGCMECEYVGYTYSMNVCGLCGGIGKVEEKTRDKVR